AGVFPSIGDEAFGITIAEAMSCGKPVIASHIGGIPEVVGGEESCGLLVPPGDVTALAQAMRRLADDAALRARLGDGARTRIERLYTWDMSAQRLLRALGM
ncbi:MAG: glycosyltransferase family 4 protein, partial [Gammaproteobacteria bacterium]|nr:glycosyltransferase family 4 protein [Gammaproteobacteria bacterium]